MTDTVPVIVDHETRRRAYDEGYDKFSDLSDGDDTDRFDLAPYKSGAGWCNHVLPRLRAMAGHADRGHGTWTENRQIVLVDDPTDRPMSGEKWEASGYLSELVEAFDSGAYDAVDGRDRYESLVY